MKTVVHGAKARTTTLVRFIMENVTNRRSAFEVSDVKSDGTVFVKFRSSPVDSASDLTRRFRVSLEGTNRRFEAVSTTQVRLALDQFSHETV